MSQLPWFTATTALIFTALEKLEPADNKYTFSANLRIVFGKFGKSTAENSYTSVGSPTLGGREFAVSK